MLQKDHATAPCCNLPNSSKKCDVITVSFLLANIQAAVTYCNPKKKALTDNQPFQSEAWKPRDLFFSPSPLIETIIPRSLCRTFDFAVWLVKHLVLSAGVTLLNLPQILLIRGPMWERWISRPAPLSKRARMMFQSGTCLTSPRVHRGDYGCWGSLLPSSPLILCPLM